MDYLNKISAWMDSHRSEAVQFLQQMIQAPSTAGYETDVQRLVADKLEQLGFTVDMWELDGEQLAQHEYFCSTRTSFQGSPNVAGVLQGTGGGRSILLNGHVDVVPAGDEQQWEHAPWSGHVEGNRVYGRGSTDMKGGNTALLFALQCLKALGISLKGDVVFHSVVEEESGGAGTLAAVLRGYRADAALIPEPTDMKIFPKQQGSMWFRIHVPGKSAHGGTRYEGVSAIDKTTFVLTVLRDLESARNAAVTEPLYREIPIPLPINVGVIRGGSWPSSVPDLVQVEGRIGVAPGESMSEVRRALEAYVAERCQEDDWLREHPPVVEWFGAQWLPGEIDIEHELVHSLKRHVHALSGREPIVEASPWGTDGGLLYATGGIPTIVFGPGTTAVAHYPNEFIEIDKMLQAAAAIALTLIDWCGVDDG